MNKVEVRAEGIPLPAWADGAAAYCRAAMEKTGFCRRELSLLFCGSNFIQELNKRFRGQNVPTDVLSFPYTALEGEKCGVYKPAGDIVISLEDMKENARLAGVPADEELRRLLIHGILHLAGCDHAGNEPGEPMLMRQEAMLKELQGWTTAI
ncbi:MAG: rRNA maturation RNase YbeY [Spirochaetaceae bacterium]|nr:rRNA maturation RNase YbeY [Spirochaetaceae bacterium]